MSTPVVLQDSFSKLHAVLNRQREVTGNYERALKAFNNLNAEAEEARAEFLKVLCATAGLSPTDLAINLVEAHEPERAVQFKMFWGGE